MRSSFAQRTPTRQERRAAPDTRAQPRAEPSEHATVRHSRPVALGAQREAGLEFLFPQRESCVPEQQVRDPEIESEHVYLDAAYARSWSLRLDLALLIRTPLALLRGTSTS